MTVRPHAHGVYVSNSQGELGQHSAFSEGGGRSCRKKPRGISGTATSQSTRTDYEWGGYLGVGNDRLEDDSDGIGEEGAEGEA
jgi:hypothetical protein